MAEGGNNFKKTGVINIKGSMKFEGGDGDAKASMSILRNVLLGSKICRSDEKKIGLGSGRSFYNCHIVSREDLADPARNSRTE